MVISIRVQVKLVTASCLRDGTFRLHSVGVRDEPRPLPVMYAGLWSTLNSLMQHKLGLDSWKPPTTRTKRHEQAAKLWHAVFVELPYLYAPPVLPSGLQGTSTRVDMMKKRICVDFHVRPIDGEDG